MVLLRETTPSSMAASRFTYMYNTWTNALGRILFSSVVMVLSFVQPSLVQILSRSYISAMHLFICFIHLIRTLFVRVYCFIIEICSYSPILAIRPSVRTYFRPALSGDSITPVSTNIFQYNLARLFSIMSRCAISSTFSDTSKVKVTYSRSNVKITSKMPSGRRITFQWNNFFELIFAISLNAYLSKKKKKMLCFVKQVDFEKMIWLKLQTLI